MEINYLSNKDSKVMVTKMLNKLWRRIDILSENFDKKKRTKKMH